MNDSDEIYDVVDADDNVIGQATRREIHQNSLLHRSAHILVFNTEGKLFLQKRYLRKDENPGLWDTSSAGHVDSGEDYLACARREMFEELGIKEKIHPFMKIPASAETFWEHVRVFQCRTGQRIRINPEEISEGKYMALEKIDKALKDNDMAFTSSFRIIFKYLRNQK